MESAVLHIDVVHHKLFPLLPSQLVGQFECINKDFQHLLSSSNDVWKSEMQKEGWNIFSPTCDKTSFVSCFQESSKAMKELEQSWSPVPVPHAFKKLVEYQVLNHLAQIQVSKPLAEDAHTFVTSPNSSHTYWIDWTVPKQRVFCVSAGYRGDGEIWFSVFIPEKTNDFSVVQTEPVFILNTAGGTCLAVLNSWDDFLILLAKGFDLESIEFYFNASNLGKKPTLFCDEDGEHTDEYKRFMQWIVQYFAIDPDKDLIPAFISTQEKYQATLDAFSDAIINSS